mmetsp:Transcript_61280/g.145902  ORF Transcript_61280/g.145902 Transcript_61280/m.145902 type:complete len:354 (-) Transcript_61280:5-1066(-)
MVPPLAVLVDRIAGALWGMFIADALAMPAHWMYSGKPEVESVLGGPVEGFVAPPLHYERSVMRLPSDPEPWPGTADIIGTVINHGKKRYWAETGFHYHCTLQKGENTLEAELARLTMRSLTRGGFDLERLRREYEEFMTTPGSHNDAWASTYHRMFFTKREKGLDLLESANNTGHHVDAIDGFIVPIPVILATAYQSREDSLAQVRESVRMARNSEKVEFFVEDIVDIFRRVFESESPHDVAQAVAESRFNKTLSEAADDPVVACAVGWNFVSLLHFLVKYQDFRACLLANANAGGENVNRGSVLGAIFGAAVGEAGIPEDLKEGLLHSRILDAEIKAFTAWFTSQSPQIKDL